MRCRVETGGIGTHAHTRTQRKASTHVVSMCAQEVSSGNGQPKLMQFMASPRVGEAAGAGAIAVVAGADVDGNALASGFAFERSETCAPEGTGVL